MAQILFTARFGGNSTGDFASFNLGDHVGDNHSDVIGNREILSKLLSQKHPVFMSQVHGNQVSQVDTNTQSPIIADALISQVPGLPLVVLSADCLPILVSSKRVVGVVHAGRKGILNGIIGKTIAAMYEVGGSDLIATIGPAICRDCYEVDPHMYQEAISLDPYLTTSDSKHSLDLRASALSQLEKVGVLVNVIDICTAHDEGYFSYRRDGNTGRNAGVIVL